MNERIEVPLSRARVATTEPKYVYDFGLGAAAGSGLMKELLGGKGAGLAEMTSLGLPVPPGFTVTTEACRRYFAEGRELPAHVWTQAKESMAKIEEQTRRAFGGEERPLLVSVRSGARVSMPGMMDTVLNLGLNDRAARALARESRDERFAADTYRRFLSMFGSVVLGVPKEAFADALDKKKKALGARLDTDLDARALQELAAEFKAIVKDAGKEIPQEPYEQLRLALRAVFDSWFGARAATYRKLYDIPEEWGTAANVQTMVFGNLGAASGSGVAFTRDPNNGERKLFGEFLFNAQGEDVVAGIRTPVPVQVLAGRMPSIFRELQRIGETLEGHYRDMLDIEFTIQEGRLFMLQVRVGKRTALAALRIALEMTRDRLIDRKAAVLRFQPEQLEQLLHPTISPDEKVSVIAKGLAASRGAAVGKAVFTAREAELAAERGEKVILVRTETSPEDVAGIHAAEGILTSRGGMTSHAAVVARGMGKCCVVGCESIVVDEAWGHFDASGIIVRAGDWITLNGATGEVILGAARLARPEAGPELQVLLSWADEYRRLGVRANADTPADAHIARKNGAEGIGLCRTEHMFFAEDRIRAVRQMLLIDDEEDRRRVLYRILPMQREDFAAMFRRMAGFPVTIRLFDPPLHEFLPATEDAVIALAQELAVEPARLLARHRSLKEFNPMLGRRGCRVGLAYPEIYEMQIRAVFEAACQVQMGAVEVHPEILIPFVSELEELRRLKNLCLKTAKDVLDHYEQSFGFTIGAMIEIPRAALLADRIAEAADFFSFGTNDLTQTTFGLSRDDAGKFLPAYIQKGILRQDPFVSVDQAGVGLLMRWAVEKGRELRPKLQIGVCGEHGGDPESVRFFHRIGLDYVSCSPYRVPVARLAAAQAALEDERAGGDASV